MSRATGQASPLITPLLVIAFACAWLLAPLAGSGAWDPYEPDSADLSRRIAVHAFGATSLQRAGDPAAMPTTGDLGMGELPFTSMALSFRVFGVSDWAGRLPLALWGLAGVLSLYVLVARLKHPRAGAFAALALCAMPLYFLHARTMLGDIVTMAAFAMATAGLSLALADRSPTVRWLALAWGTLGLLSGYFTRGALFGLAAPLLSVGFAGLVGLRPRRTRWIGAVASALFVAAGAAAALWFIQRSLPTVAVASSTVHPTLERAVGMVLFDPTPADSTFDRVIRQLGHGLFPWAGVVLVALGWLFAPPTTVSSAPTDGRASFLNVLLLLGSAVSFGASTLVVPWAGALPFAGVAMLAGAVGVLGFELDDAPASRLAGLAALLVTCIVYVDVEREPARMLAAFVVDAAAFPASFNETSRSRTLFVTLLAGLGAFLALAVGRSDEAAAVLPRLSISEARGALGRWARGLSVDARGAGRALYEAFQGNLVFCFVVLEAALVGLAGMLLIASRAGWARIAKLPPSVISIGQVAWWAVPLAAVALPVGWILLRDGFRAFGRVTGVSRGASLAIAMVGSGALLAFGYYPALSAQLSPKGVFEVYAAVAKPRDELALLGTSPRAGALYAKGPVVSFSDVGSAFDWLDSDTDVRRFLILKARDLPKLNGYYRARHAHNVPVLDARSSQNVLVSRALEGAVDQNPFAAIVLDEVPSIARPVEARFLENLELLGWEVTDDRGRPIASVKARKPFKLRIYFRVLKRTPGSWQVFVHIDGNERHQTVDHEPAGGAYPMAVWQPGDIIRDEVEVSLEPNMTPGEYWVLFGFFQGTTRLHVASGPSKDDRVTAGRLVVK